MSLDDLKAQQARRQALIQLALFCLCALALAFLAFCGPSDAYIAGASTGDGCGGWRDEVEQAFGPAQTNTACRVLLCESGGDPGARSRTNDHGLLQINAPTWNRPSHPDPVAQFIGHHWDVRYHGWSNLVMAQKIQHHYGWGQWACAR